jgi:glyoxylase-like metal-dependent hydrolase (beta-lactamase superfamily II)
MRTTSWRTTLLIAALAAPGVTTAQQPPPTPTRGITNIAGQLYRAQNDNHYNVFLVTPEGVILTDPISRDFALWLKQEIAQRFKQPVRYVLYSHHDWDHASGGAVFADTAQFVGHVSMPNELAVPAGNLPLPAALQKLDVNSNGVLDRSEATGPAAATFALTDANGDGLLTGAEAARGPVNDVYPPTWTFTDRRVIALGGKTAVLIHIGTAHAPDSSVIHFPAERTIFGADTIQVKRLPLSLGPHMGAWHDTLRAAMAIDFDIVAPGHGNVGTKKDLAALQQYIVDLTGGVAAGVAANRSLAEIQKTLMLEPYRTFERWDTHRQAHIAEVYATMKGTP